MKLSDTQHALLLMQLAKLAQDDLTANDQDVLEHLAIMLEMALENVRNNINIKMRLGGTLPQVWVLTAKKKDDTENDR